MHFSHHCTNFFIPLEKSVFLVESLARFHLPHVALTLLPLIIRCLDVSRVWRFGNNDEIKETMHSCLKDFLKYSISSKVQILVVCSMQTIQLTFVSFELLPQYEGEVPSLQEGSYIFRNLLSRNPITACGVTRRSTTERTDRLADSVQVLSWA